MPIRRFPVLPSVPPGNSVSSICLPATVGWPLRSVLLNCVPDGFFFYGEDAFGEGGGLEKGWFVFPWRWGMTGPGTIVSLDFSPSCVGNRVRWVHSCHREHALNLFSFVTKTKAQNYERRPFSVSFSSAAQPPSHSHLNEVLSQPLKTASLSLPKLGHTRGSSDTSASSCALHQPLPISMSPVWYFLCAQPHNTSNQD